MFLTEHERADSPVLQQQTFFFRISNLFEFFASKSIHLGINIKINGA
jgi:hypothetical protein